MQQVQVKQYIEIVVLMKFKPTQFCYITKLESYFLGSKISLRVYT